VTASAEATRARRTLPRGRRLGSFVSPFIRHVLVLAVAALATYGLAGALPAPEQPTLWLVAAAGLGLVAALLGRRLLGVLFLTAGTAIGLLVHLHIRLGSGEEALHELSEHAALYGAALGASVVAYFVTVLVVEFVARRLSARDSRSTD
jgi:hypothetical protein